MNVTILNTSILTSFGSFKYESITVDDARSIASLGFESAVGHESTAQLISTLLDIDCKINRIQYRQDVGDKALVFKLNGRTPEGVILSKTDIENIGYEWGLLTRTA